MTGFFSHFHHRKDKDKGEDKTQAKHQAPQCAASARHGHFDAGDYLSDAQFEQQFPGLSAKGGEAHHHHHHHQPVSSCGGGHAPPVAVSSCGASHRPPQVSSCQASARPVHHAAHAVPADPNAKSKEALYGAQQGPVVQMPDYLDYIQPPKDPQPAHDLAGGDAPPAMPQPAVVAAVAAAAALTTQYAPPAGPPPTSNTQDPPAYAAPSTAPRDADQDQWTAQMDPDAIGMEAAMNAMQMMSTADAGPPPPGLPPGAAPPAETGWDAGKMDPDVIGMSAAMEAMQMMSAEPGMEEMMKEMNKVEEAIPVAPVAEEEKPAPADPAPAPPVVETPQVPEPTPEEKPAPAPAPVEERVEAPAPAPAAEEDDEDESGGPPPSVAAGIAGLLGAAGAGSSPREKLVALAVLQAGKLFDRKNGGKPLDPEAKAMKIQALNSAANSVLRLASQYRMSGAIMPKPGEIQSLINTALTLF